VARVGFVSEVKLRGVPSLFIDIRSRTAQRTNPQQTRLLKNIVFVDQLAKMLPLVRGRALTSSRSAGEGKNWPRTSAQVESACAGHPDQMSGLVTRSLIVNVYQSFNTELYKFTV
jgi:hypothetical protein